MLSGNGRHRRPRQAPALLVAAGVTGSAIAIPLLAASGASAADGTVWDKVAQCETGGSWSAGKGGEYGGLSLTQKQWETYGGLDYAKSADLASRNQQIAVAQKVLAAENVGAWGTCAVTAGLTQDNGALNVDTGVVDDSSDVPPSTGSTDLPKGLDSGSSDPSDPSDPSGSPSVGSGSPGASETPESPTDLPSSPATSPTSPSSSLPTGTGDPAGTGGSPVATSDPVNSGEPGKSFQGAGSWSLVDTSSLGLGKHRGPVADESDAPTTKMDPGTDGIVVPETVTENGVSISSAGEYIEVASYVVQEGDSLVSIADSLGIVGGWRALYAENRDLIGADPNGIAPGQTLDTAV